MRKLLLLPFLLFIINLNAQICNPNGNLVIYSNYDGGLLSINVDVDIPNLVIGVSSYEFTRIVISGTYADNVVGVHYAGYNADNDHCGIGGPMTTTITGAAGAATSIEFLPDAPFTEAGLPTYIIYNYECTSDPSGSGNNPEQLVAYFSQFGGGIFRFHKNQYGCWSGTQSISAGGTCCLSNEVVIPGCTDPTACNYNADATEDDGSCFYAGNSGGCTDPSACNYEAEAIDDDGSCLYYCYGCFDENACNYDPDATIEDSCDYSCQGCTYPDAMNFNAAATRDDGSCVYSCEADFNNDGLINAADLLQFLIVFGGPCE